LAKKPVVRVCISPALYELYRQAEGVTVVVDIFRATTAICTALQNGVNEIIPVASIHDAKRYQEDDEVIIAAERGGEIVDGFKYGNSPLSYINNPDIAGKTLVLTTTNGTQAIDAAKNDGDLVIGAFSNLEVLTEWLIKENQDVMILCSGWKNRLNLEDSLFAGAVVDALLKAGFEFDIDSDAAIIARLLYTTAEKDLSKFLENSSHRNRLKNLNLEDDIEYCLTLNTCQVVPKLIGNSIKNAIRPSAH
jgi:2-phosphosulfolactate phosphatase